MNVDKRQIMVMEREKGSICEVSGDEEVLEHSPKLKYLGLVLKESSTNGAEECCSKVPSREVSCGNNQIAYKYCELTS